MTDLFEHPEQLPKQVQEVLTKFEESEFNYTDCENLVNELREVGYTCEYYLDAEPYNLQKIER